MPKKKKEIYEQIHDGDWVWLAKRMDIECCDCGLVHRVKFKEGKDRKIYWIVRRLVGKTRTERKRRGIIFAGQRKC